MAGARVYTLSSRQRQDPSIRFLLAKLPTHMLTDAKGRFKLIAYPNTDYRLYAYLQVQGGRHSSSAQQVIGIEERSVTDIELVLDVVVGGAKAGGVLRRRK